MGDAMTPRANSIKASIKANDNLRHIPGSFGWPVIGNTVAFLRDPIGYVERMYQKFGSIYRDHMFFEYSVDIVHPDAVAQVLGDREGTFSARLGWFNMFGRLFANGLLLRDHGDHAFHRGILQVVFYKKAVRTYTEAINPLVGRALHLWGSLNDFDLYDRVKKATLDTAAVVFLGLELGPDVERVNRAFVHMMDAVTAVGRWDLPGTTFGRGMRGRRELEAFFRQLIPARRAGTGEDLFSHLCRAESESGERFSDDEVVDHTVFLLMAAHDTTTSALANLILELALQPELQQRLREECFAVGTDVLAYEDIGRLPGTFDAFRETLRLYPPVRSIPRRTEKACEIMGYEIPANTNVWLVTGFIHLHPDYWTEPARFDPDRFSDVRAEHKRHRFAWVPFGTGAHTCLGLHFAEVQVKTFMYQMLRMYRWELPEGYQPKRTYVPIPRLADRPPVRFTRL